MLTPIEKSLLKEMLALAAIPEQTMNYNELMGYLYGVAITPETIPSEEWMPVIFGDEESPVDPKQIARSLSTVLEQVLENFLAMEQRGELHFPFQLDDPDDNPLEEVFDWVSGFEFALSLRPEVWEPEPETVPPEQMDELMFSMMVILGLIDPEGVMPFFEKLPDELFAETFPQFDPGQDNREIQVQSMLLSTLPLAVDTLQSYGKQIRKLYKKKPEAKMSKSTASAKKKPTRSTGKSGNIIKVDFGKNSRTSPKQGKATTKQIPAYQLKIGLKKAKPPIWRRVQVPGETTLAQLHTIIQTSMGWEDYHLHQFEIKKSIYGPAIEENNWDMFEVLDEKQYTLHTLAKSIQPHFDYTYDFGDNWEHRITVEKILEPEECQPYPVIVKGKRACPPEDIGGIWGYSDFLESYFNQEDEQHEEVVEFVGPDFQPEQFSKEEMAEANNQLEKIFKKRIR